ncbi:hypothetical protein ABGB07_14475 [Micromonosporaceae bacterium B7E4]
MTSLDDLVARLRLLKAWSQDMSYAAVTRIVNDRWRRAGRPDSELTTRSTVAGYFAFGRSRLDEDLLVAIVTALHPEPEYAERWRRTLRMIRGDATAAASVDARCDLSTGPEGFVGRGAELRHLDELAGARRIVVVQGMAGVGKTWLARHATHRIGGCRVRLAADLRGFGAGPPACPSAVLAGFLRRLGLRYDQIPRDLAARRAAYRALTRDVPVLVVLDDAADEHVVAPLLPGGPDRVVVVTSRRALTGLRGAAHLPLTALDPAASLDLLRRVAGAARIDADVAGARRTARRVGHHPLALSIIGRHLREHPDWPGVDYARPVALVLARGVRSGLAASVGRLPDATGHVLRLLALHPGHDIDCRAVAVLADMTVDTARTHLDTLVRAHLLQHSSTGRYSLHELARGYAAEAVRLEEPASQVRAATGRLFGYYRRTAAVAVARLSAAGRPQSCRAGPSPTPHTVAEARRWMADEHANLLGLTAHAVARGSTGLAYDLVMTLWRYQRGSGAGSRCPRSSELGDHAGRAERQYANEYPADRRSREEA